MARATSGSCPAVEMMMFAVSQSGYLRPPFAQDLLNKNLDVVHLLTLPHCIVSLPSASFENLFSVR